jgi:hypothetical protein
MNKDSIIEESFWFIKIKSSDNQTLDSSEVFLKILNEKLVEKFNLEYESEKSSFSNFSKLNDSANNEYILFHLLKLGSFHKFIDDKDFFNELSRLVNLKNRDLLRIISIFENSKKIISCFQRLSSESSILFINYAGILQLISFYIDLTLYLELANIIMPSERIRDKNKIDSKIKSFKKLDSISSKTIFKIPKKLFVKYDTLKDLFDNQNNISFDFILDLIKDVFSGRHNRIDKYLLPKISKMIWISSSTNDTDCFHVLIPLFKILKSISEPNLIIHDNYSDFYNDTVEYDKFGENFKRYCFYKMNELIRTNKGKYKIDFPTN